MARLNEAYLRNPSDSSSNCSIDSPFFERRTLRPDFSTSCESSSAEDDFTYSSSVEPAPQMVSKANNPFAFGEGALVKTSSSSSSSSSPVQTIVESSKTSLDRTVDLLKRLNGQDGTTLTATSIVREAIKETKTVKKSFVEQIPARFRSRVLSDLDHPQPLNEIPLIFGRFFNLSLNLKILADGGVFDPYIVSRIVSDLFVIEVSLEERLDEEGIAADFLSDLSLN